MSGVTSYFERLVEATGLIARHPDYPGKQQVVDRCVEEIAELLRSGQVTAAQGEILLENLEVAGPRPQPEARSRSLASSLRV
jgi:hypothetical protein